MATVRKIWACLSILYTESWGAVLPRTNGQTVADIDLAFEMQPDNFAHCADLGPRMFWLLGKLRCTLAMMKMTHKHVSLRYFLGSRDALHSCLLLRNGPIL